MTIKKLGAVYLGDCLTGMGQIKIGTIDMILTDLPYGQTARNKWDKVLPFDRLWEQYCRIIKDNGAIVLFANGMFTANLMRSNPKMWRYNLVWDKKLTTGFLNANRQFLRQHEDICVFYKKQPAFYPLKTEGAKNHSRGKAVGQAADNCSVYGDYIYKESNGNLKYPTSIISCPKVHPSKCVHPTQKPVALLEYLILTYTNLGDIVLDSCAGSGSTCLAALRTGRRFAAFEKETAYYEQIKERIKEELQ